MVMAITHHVCHICEREQIWTMGSSARTHTKVREWITHTGNTTCASTYLFSLSHTHTHKHTDNKILKLIYKIYQLNRIKTNVVARHDKVLD